MKKAVFILVVDNDLSDYSGLIGRIKELSTAKNLYKVSDSFHLIETFKAVEGASDSVFQTEVRVIIDLNLPFFEAYVCLQALAAFDFKSPVRVYLLEDEYTIRPSPSIDQYTIAGCFDKPLRQEHIAQILEGDDSEYFQKEAGSFPEMRFNNSF